MWKQVFKYQVSYLQEHGCALYDDGDDGYWYGYNYRYTFVLLIYNTIMVGISKCLCLLALFHLGPSVPYKEIPQTPRWKIGNNANHSGRTKKKSRLLSCVVVSSKV
jgi:hypothetical protein